MKILWLSNSPHTGTGYGNQSQIVYEFTQFGHEVIGVANWGITGSPMNIGGITWLPSFSNSHGGPELALYSEATKADISITLYDSWVFSKEHTANIRWVPYLPIDSDPPNPFILEALQTSWRQIVYSKFAKTKLENAGFKPYYVPHFVDENMFKRNSDDRNKELRRIFRIPDNAFVISIVAANKGNPSRKAFYEQFCAIAEFSKANPDVDVYTILHTNVFGFIGGETEPLDQVMHLAGLDPAKVRVPNAFEFSAGIYDDNHLRNIYNVADVTMMMTRGEGFGVPIIQSTACQTPVIVTDYTAMTELAGELHGWAVKPEAYSFYGVTKMAIPSISGGVAALNAALKEKKNGNLRVRGQKAAEATIKEYGKQNVVNRYWKPVLEDLTEAIELIKSFESGSTNGEAEKNR